MRPGAGTGHLHGTIACSRNARGMIGGDVIDDRAAHHGVPRLR
jgi:hypothetical protein